MSVSVGVKKMSLRKGKAATSFGGVFDKDKQRIVSANAAAPTKIHARPPARQIRKNFPLRNSSREPPARTNQRRSTNNEPEVRGRGVVAKAMNRMIHPATLTQDFLAAPADKRQIAEMTRYGDECTELGHLETRFHQLEQNSVLLENELDNYKSQIKSEKKDNERLWEESKNLKSQNKELESELWKIKGILESRETELEETKKRAAVSAADVEKQTKTVARLKDEMKSMRQKFIEDLHSINAKAKDLEEKYAFSVLVEKAKVLETELLEAKSAINEADSFIEKVLKDTKDDASDHSQWRALKKLLRCPRAGHITDAAPPRGA